MKYELLNIKKRMREISKEQKTLLDSAETAKRGLNAEEQKKYDALDVEYDQLAEKRDELEAGPSEAHQRFLEMNLEPLETRNNAIQIFDGKKNNAMFKTGNNNSYVFDENGKTSRDAFNRYLRYGVNSLSPAEFRALQADSDTAGGYLVAPVDLAKSVLMELDNEVFVRQYATKFQVPNAQSLGAPFLSSDFGDPSWTSELGTGSEDSDMDFERRDLYPHAVARRIKVSNKLLRASALNPENVVMQRMIYKMSTVHENAFLNGTGLNQPLGVFTPSNLGISTDRDVSTGNTTTNCTVDGLINCVGSLKSQYRANARWVFHRDLETRLKKLKDGEGRYLWQGSIDGKAPNMLLGFPIHLSEYAPNTFSAEQYVAVLGDFRFYYCCDALDMQIQRLIELYSETNQTGYIIRSETDGMPVLESAFVRVQLAS